MPSVVALDGLVQENAYNWVTAGFDQFRLPTGRLLAAGIDGLTDDEVAVLAFTFPTPAAPTNSSPTPTRAASRAARLSR